MLDYSNCKYSIFNKYCLILYATITFICFTYTGNPILGTLNISIVFGKYEKTLLIKVI